MDMREKVRNDVMLLSMDMLGNVLAKVLSGAAEALTTPGSIWGIGTEAWQDGIMHINQMIMSSISLKGMLQ